MKEASDMAGCLQTLPAEMQRPGVKAARGRKLRVSRTQQCCMNLCCPCVQSRNQFPGILLFDLGASLLCHKTGNHLTGWMTGSCWAPLGLGAHCSSPAHTPCHPPPPPLTSSFFARPRIHNEEQSRRGDEPQLLPGPSGAELVSSPATGVGQVLRENRRGVHALRPYDGPRMGGQQRLQTLPRPPHL